MKTAATATVYIWRFRCVDIFQLYRTYLYVDIYILKHISSLTYMCIFERVMCVYIHIYIHIFYIHVYIYISKNTCIYIYVHVYTCIHCV